jgi:diguanylate cyclase (GGDEF)-like protein
MNQNRQPAGAPALRRRWHFLLWPALALLLLLGWWTYTVIGVRREMAHAEQAANKDAAAFAEAYEQYITRSLAQMDQVTMQLKQSWEQSGGTLDLALLRRDGMFTDSAFVDVTIYDATGRLRSSTHRHHGADSVQSQDFFTHHQNNNSTALSIAVPRDQTGTSQSTVQFSRRLDGPDDTFGGALVLTVQASYFTSFYSSRTLGRNGLVALLGDGGNLRLERHGASATGLEDSSLLRQRPALEPDEGVRMLDGEQGFRDDRTRIMAWHRSSAYPVVALVAMDSGEALAAAMEVRAARHRNALLATVLLLPLSLWAAVLARRTQRRKHEEEEVRRAYRTATESANDGFYMAAALRDADGEIVDFEVVDCNERGAYFYGMRREELIGKRLSDSDSGVFGSALFETYVAAMASGFYEDDRQMPEDNRLKISWGHRRLVRVGNGLAITLQDISERKAHEEDLERLANQDALTALPNRHWLNHFLPGALAGARARGTAMALLFIDLDEFKHVNDTQGHAAGDMLLRQAAARLKSLLRPGDRVVRFGGDEFIVLLDPAESDAQVAAVADRILKAFTRPFEVGEESQSVGASIGISLFPRDGEDPESLIKHGDIAMYSGKSEGKGQYRFFDPALYTRLKSRARLKHQLFEAIEGDQLQLYYQPRVDTRTGVLCSMEALVRWVHPELGLIPPLDFIPLAESSGLILQIGEIVMAKACAQLAAWQAKGLPLVPVSINVSPKQFAHGNIHRQLAVHLARHQVDASLLEVEITESAMMGEQDEIIAELAAIRDLGVKLHVDDFGTGYSSLSQLQKLRMDVLKVDKAFTSELCNSQEGRVFFQAIVSMAHALGMSVVAEGVETLEQLRALQELECNEVQGYYVARPMPPADIEVCMRRRLLFPNPTDAAQPALRALVRIGA